MDYLLDDPLIEKTYQDILLKIRKLQNGEVANSMKRRGIEYKVNYGVGIPMLQELAQQYSKNHLLALKLWNKQWRETMILATLLEEPAEVTVNQINFWAKNLPTVEMAEQAAMNLFSQTTFAYPKAIEFCHGKKLVVKIFGLLLAGRLALTDKNATDEQFDPFFELMSPLSKDAQLELVFSRIFIQIGMRNLNLLDLTIQHAKILKTNGSSTSQQNADVILGELDHDDIRALVKTRDKG
jgi:DNA alkylation repair enzyme